MPDPTDFVYAECGRVMQKQGAFHSAIHRGEKKLLDARSLADRRERFLRFLSKFDMPDEFAQDWFDLLTLYVNNFTS